MHCLAIAIIVFAVALVLALAGCRERAQAEPEPPAPAASAPAKPGSTSRADVARKLSALAASKPPTKLALGAMCYEPAAMPDRGTYTCPTCSEKTVYAQSGGDRPDTGVTWLLDRDLPACRRLVKEIRGLDVRLDESEFCKKCQPDAKDPKLVLVVRFADDAQEVRTRYIGEDDLRLLQEFLAGDAKHKTGNDGETALKDRLPRLQELLGVKPQRPEDNR